MHYPSILAYVEAIERLLSSDDVNTTRSLFDNLGHRGSPRGYLVRKLM
jgi:hypothetical protein